MASVQEYREQLKVEIHSLLCTEKNPIPARQLHKNYRELMSSCIFWVRLGHNSLEDLLNSMKDTVRCTHANGQLMVSAIPREESAHIRELVAGQKLSKNNKNHAQQHYRNHMPFACVNNNRRLGNRLLPSPQEKFTSYAPNQDRNEQLQRPMRPNESRESANQPLQQPLRNQTPLEPVQPVYMPYHGHSLLQNSQSATPQVSGNNPYTACQINAERSNQSSKLGNPDRVPGAQNEEQCTKEQVEKSASNHARPGVDIKRLRRLMTKKLTISQAASTEPNYQRDGRTQTVETLQTLSRLESDKDNQCPETEPTPREVHSRASTEDSVPLPTISYSTSPTVSVTSHMTSLSRPGDTTFVRVIPQALPLLSKSHCPSISSLPAFKKRDNEEAFYLEQLKDMSKRGAIRSVSLRHLRLANGRYRAFVDVDGMEFSTHPTDFAQYTDAYEEAARRACLHFENAFDQLD